MILVVDDDARLRALLSRYLAEHGFRVTTAANAAEARAELRSLSPDLMVLDVMMPGEDGLDLTGCRCAREPAGELPVLLLTARGAPEDRIAGFEAGADDYLRKPFEPRELVLRIRALLRRCRAACRRPQRRAGRASVPLIFDPARGELRGPDGPMRLTGGEAALLDRAAPASPTRCCRARTIAAALGMDEAGERAIDVQVTRLRRKIEADPREPRFLHTVRGRGYVLKPGR